MFIYSISDNKEISEEDTELTKICFTKDIRILPGDYYVEHGDDWVEVGNPKRKASIRIDRNTEFRFNTIRRYRLFFRTQDTYTKILHNGLNHNLEAAKQWFLIGEAWFSLAFCTIYVRSNQNKAVTIYVPPGYVVKYKQPGYPPYILYEAK